jgi:hypothetical protein
VGDWRACALHDFAQYQGDSFQSRKMGEGFAG